MQTLYSFDPYRLLLSNFCVTPIDEIHQNQLEQLNTLNQHLNKPSLQYQILTLKATFHIVSLRVLRQSNKQHLDIQVMKTSLFQIQKIHKLYSAALCFLNMISCLGSNYAFVSKIFFIFIAQKLIKIL
ncbi:transmembrane protein, putative (macronuclear) [Tetrahymena thermophila SB210]|uniref:Transmembrane protein, putative n=1 Tax=Tetrahymena thermophila (strain SB210) TaxID=312017 RepID=W7XJ77_TETTS|nr:transmembrane protein, putative [Tetrahymena thermophila SB210]EWS73919.1 transmembrane protein, putative [Tetrahymena thermophila SB210]|eukprot:XP_012653541.1 transmembrane protein, putative [Tetrahymena thermophila SB210]